MVTAANSRAMSREDDSPVRTIAIAALVAICTFVAFLPALSAGFVNWDDDLLLLENPNWRGLTPRHFGWMFTTTHMGPYQPLAWLSYSIDERLWGLRPAPFHATNLVFHTITATLFFLLGRRLIRSATRASGLVLDLASAAAALLFSVHPLRVESVAWVTERRDVLCGVFFVGALLAYVRAAEDVAASRRRRVLSLASIALVILAALSKGWAMTLPALMLVLDFYPLRRHPRMPWRRLIIEKAPVLLVAALAALVAYFGQRSGAWGPQQFAHRGVGERIAQAGYALAFYPAKSLWPARLLPIYELPPSIRLTDPRYAIPTIAVAATTVAAWLARRRRTAAPAAWLAYLVTIAPFIGIAQAGNQIVADRYSYLSCLSFPLLAGAGLAIAARRYERRAARLALCGASIIVIGLLAAQTWNLTRSWQDSFSLWRRAIAINPESWVSHSNLGDALRKAGNRAEAKEHFARAVSINPGAGVAWLNLGELLKADGDLAEAETALRQAADHHPEPPLAELQLGEICARTNRPAEALTHFIAASNHPKTAAWAEFGAGVILRITGRPGEAADHLRRAIELDPSIPGIVQELKAAEALAGARVYPTSTGPYKQN
jgi:tetratricopeptide (TPR) repeat protein